MKKIIFSLAVALASVFNVCAQDAPQATYVGYSEPVVEIRGSSWLLDYTSLGWSVGSYSDAPGERYNSIMLYNYSSSNIQIQPGSKLILKVDGKPMVLTTARGTYYDGSTVFAERRYVSAIGWVDYYASSVFYELTQEQADAINTYGITKYRYQIEGDVIERDNMNNVKIAKKMKKSYDKLTAKQDKITKKVNDLSDF